MKTLSKLLLFIIVIITLLMCLSCSSFFITGTEQYNKMYVTDTLGCRFINVHVVTTKKGLTVQRLSFIALTDRDSIRIPLLEFDYNKPIYNGTGMDNIKYTVKYDHKIITINSSKGTIILNKPCETKKP